MLDLVDDVAAGAERLVAMARADADPDRQLADAELADAMHAGGALHAELRAGLGDDPLALADCELGEGLVFEAHDGQAVVVVADPALERRIAARRRIGQRTALGVDVEGGAAEAEAAHLSGFQPPATGGMKTTVSPAASGCDQSPNSALTATRSTSVPSVKGWRARSSS